MLRLEWHGDEIKSMLKEAAADGLIDAVEFLLEQADKDVPLKEGTLQDSGEASVDKEVLTAAISYDTPYAVRLHEHPEYEFQGGRKGKWLENTINEKGNVAADYLAKKLSEKLD